MLRNHKGHLPNFFFKIALIVLLFGTQFLVSCGTIKPNKPEIKPQEEIEPTPTYGNISMPIEIQLSTLGTVLDLTVPSNFEDSMVKCQGLSYHFNFHRQPFQLNSAPEGIKVKISGEYGASVSFCAKCVSYRGRPERCITGKFDLSCGMGEDKPKRVELDLTSRVILKRDYSLQAKTSIDELNIIDPCEVTFLKLDATKIFESKLLKQLDAATSELDELVANLDLKSSVEKGWKELNKDIPVRRFGYVSLNPKGIRIDPLSFENDVISTKVQIELAPEFTTEKQKRSPSKLPNLAGRTTSDGINIPLKSTVSFKSFNAKVKKSFKGTELVVKKRKINLTKIKVVGGNEGRAVFAVSFNGWREGIIYLTGSPVFVDSTQTLEFRDISFDLETKSVLLKSAKWLLNKRLTKTVEEKLKLPLNSTIKKATEEAEKALNTAYPIDGYGSMHIEGKVNRISVEKIAVLKDSFEFLIFLDGEASVKF